MNFDKFCSNHLSLFYSHVLRTNPPIKLGFVVEEEDRGPADAFFSPRSVAVIEPLVDEVDARDGTAKVLATLTINRANTRQRYKQLTRLCICCIDVSIKRIRWQDLLYCL